MSTPVKILIAEDSKIFAQGLETLLNQNPSLQVLAILKQPEKIFEYLKSTIVHLVILDLNFETATYDGFQIAKKIKEEYPHIKIIVLTQYARVDYYNRLIKEIKVEGYIDKKIGIEEIKDAINEVMAGELYVDESIEKILLIGKWMKVTSREETILALLEKGHPQKYIAIKLGVSQRTIEVHIRNLFEKLEAKNSTELVAKFISYKRSHREDVDASTPPFKKL